MLFHQLFEPESSTYTYLLADEVSKEAVLIDTVLETVDRDLQLLSELGLKLVWVLDTHVHADHITGANELRNRVGAKTCLSKYSNVTCADRLLVDGDTVSFGSYSLKALETPGHTDSCMSYHVNGMIFTGDVLLIRGTGRTDFQQGSPQKMYQSITEKIFTLPDETKIYPGHDYKGFSYSSVALEKQFNPRIGAGKSLEEFIKIMSELKLANPKKIHEAVPANLKCGIKQDTRVFHPQIVDGVPEITVQDLEQHIDKLGKAKLIDVRSEGEYHSELGHIKGAVLATLGPDLESFFNTANKDNEYIFVCRSGGRSASAARMAISRGFTKAINMQGGMLSWNQQKYPVEF